MTEDDRINEILKIIKNIQESRQPVKKYFEQNLVPFSRSQYYIYCKTLQKYGEEGLYDQREDGNNTKLTQRIKDFIVTTVKDNRSISSSELKDKIASVFGVNCPTLKGLGVPLHRTSIENSLTGVNSGNSYCTHIQYIDCSVMIPIQNKTTDRTTMYPYG